MNTYTLLNMEYHETVWHRRHLDFLAHSTFTEYLVWFYIQILARGIITDFFGTDDICTGFGTGIIYSLFCIWDTFRLITAGILRESLPQWILGYSLATRYTYTRRMFDKGDNYGLFGTEVNYKLFVTGDIQRLSGRKNTYRMFNTCDIYRLFNKGYNYRRFDKGDNYRIFGTRNT